MDDLNRSHIAHPTGLIVAAVALLLIGLVMVASASASLTDPLVGPAIWRTPFGRQLIFAAVGVAAMLLTARFARPLLASQRGRRGLGKVVFMIVLGCLAVALIPGLTDSHRGAQRWLRLAGAGFVVSFQPSEFAKLAMVAFLAGLLTKPGTDVRSFRRGFLPAAGAVAACVLLVGMEDYGTAALFAVIGALTLFVAGCRLRHLLALGSIGVVGMTALLFAQPYRLERLEGFRGFWEDPLGAGYQPIQSLTAIATGGWLGSGLGAGAAKYGYLPESHTDFIFSMICEETGVLGGGLVIALFCAFVWLGLGAMRAAPSRFERILAFGLTATVGLQAAMNIAVVTVLTPTTGISLPLISAGGSGVTAFCIAIGILSAIATRGRQVDLFALNEDERGGSDAEPQASACAIARAC